MNTTDVLVACASGHGSAKGVAERIAAAIPSSTVRPMSADLDTEYGAYILGSARSSPPQAWA